MTLSANDVPLRHGFDPGTDPALLAHHRDEWNRLREESPVFRSDLSDSYDLWFLLKHQDMLAMFQDYETFSSRTVQILGDNGTHRLNPTELDPPEHTKYRRFLSQHFAPKEVRSWEPDIRQLCASLLDELVDKKSIDFVKEFAQRFPTTVFLEIMGLPAERCSEFIARAHRVLNTTNAQDPDGSLRRAASAEIVGDLAELYARRRVQPQDDLASRLLSETVDGAPVTDEALYEIGFLLYLAGLDTVANMLAYSFRYLAEHPDLRTLLIRDPNRIPDAVEEFLRLYALATGAREVTRDVEFAGCPMKAGDRVVYVTASAGRDPDAFDDPDEFKIDRSPNRHISFAAGPHRCVGSHLARLELQIALEMWHERIPDYSIPAGAVITEHVGTVAGLDNLPLEW